MTQPASASLAPTARLRGRGGPWAAGLCLALASAAPAGLRAQPAAPELPAVVVSSTRDVALPADTPASLDLLDGQALRHMRAQIDLSEGLSGVPGLLIQNRHNYAQDLQLSVRGFGARSAFGIRGVRLVVDGIPATQPDGQGQLSHVDIGTADTIEVLRGPFSALHGNAAGGLISVTTEDGNGPPSATTTLSSGSNGAQRLGLKASGSAQQPHGPLRYVLSVNRWVTDGWRDHSKADRSQASAKLSLPTGPGHTTTLVMNRVDSSAQDPLGLTRAQWQAAPRSAPLAATQYDTRKQFSQTQVGLTHTVHINGQQSLRWMAYGGERRTLQFQSIPAAVQASALHPGGVIDLNRRFGGLDLRLTTATSLAGAPLTWIAGLAFDRLHEDRRGYQNFSGPLLGVAGALRREETNTLSNLDPYWQARWQWAPRWSLDAGLRYTQLRFVTRDHYRSGPNGDDSGTVQWRQWLPLLALQREITPSMRVYASVGRGVETPTLNEIAYRPDGTPGLNLGLDPARSTSAEVGLRTQTPNGQLSLALFAVRTSQEIVALASNQGRTVFQNAGRTRRQGLEASGSQAWAIHGRTHWSVSGLDARITDDGPDLRAGARIAGTARLMGSLALAWEPPTGFQVQAGLRALSRVTANNSNTESAPGYAVLGIAAGWRDRLGPWQWSAHVRIDNALDRRYVGSVIVNESNGRFFESAPGRQWSAGLSATYPF